LYKSYAIESFLLVRNQLSFDCLAFALSQNTASFLFNDVPLVKSIGHTHLFPQLTSQYKSVVLVFEELELELLEEPQLDDELELLELLELPYIALHQK
jgi:hypothetical protein